MKELMEMCDTSVDIAGGLGDRVHVLGLSMGGVMAAFNAQFRKDIESGKKRLGSIMGDDFYPLFTPPWNRCSASAMDSLGELGYRAISRSSNSKPPAPSGLPDIQVNVDLHTRKETDPEASWQNLLGELERGLSSGICGIMIHHQLMNEAAFDFLEILLMALVRNKQLNLVHFQD